MDQPGKFSLPSSAMPERAFISGQFLYQSVRSATKAPSGIAEDGSEHFPGWSLEALKYIYEERNAAANGPETLDTDASAEAAKAGDLACERYVLGKGKLQIEVLCNLDKVAPAGAVLFAAWPKIEGATGLPARVWAITE